jgi:DNA-binding CsgD family transcriptional regulator
VKYGGPCICGKASLRLSIVTEGICNWCGRGVPTAPAKIGRGSRLRRLPWDLGAFVREGRHPDPHLDNVVRLDRLRDRWKVPPVPEGIDPGGWPLTAAQHEALSMASTGLLSREIGEQLGITKQAVDKRLEDACLRLGVSRRRDAIEIWERQQGAASCDELRGAA